MDARLLKCIDEWEINRLSHDYAQAVDRRDEARLLSLFMPDGVLEGPGWRRSGRAEIAGVMAFLNTFVATWHSISTQTIHIEGDRAHGETYCTARHLQKGGLADNQVMTMTIRYQDRFVRDEGRWRIENRRLIVDWTECSTIQSGLRE